MLLPAHSKVSRSICETFLTLLKKILIMGPRAILNAKAIIVLVLDQESDQCDQL